MKDALSLETDLLQLILTLLVMIDGIYFKLMTITGQVTVKQDARQQTRESKKLDKKI